MTLHSPTTHGLSIKQRLAVRLACHWQLFKLRQAIKRERQLLRSLDERALKDIGISRVDALIEARRPGRDIPAYRLPRIVDNQTGRECICGATELRPQCH